MEPNGGGTMKTNPKEVGQRIKSIRINLKETTAKFAQRFDPPASDSLVSRWERGVNLPNNERLKEIAEFGDLSIPELLYGPSKDYEAMWKELKKEVEITASDEFGNPATQYHLENFLKVMNKLEEEN